MLIHSHHHESFKSKDIEILCMAHGGNLIPTIRIKGISITLEVVSTTEDAVNAIWNFIDDLRMLAMAVSAEYVKGEE